jgi:hypothetical protein
VDDYFVVHLFVPFNLWLHMGPEPSGPDHRSPVPGDGWRAGGQCP